MIKRYNEITGQWEVIGSANAGSIKLDNPEFSKPSGDPVTVSEGFSALTEDLELVKANIAWLFKNSTSPGIIDTITPHIKDDVWWIGPVDTGIPARGKSPEFRKGDTGIEWRYQGESDWTVLVLFEDLIFKFSDLTPEQIDQLRLKYEDLTPEQIAELQKPANDMIVVLEQTNTTIQAAENSRVTEWARIKSEAEDATEISKEATQESKDATAASEAATIASQTATTNANQATTAANTATGLANTATTNANLAAQEARDAAAAVEDGKTPVLQIGNVQKGTTAAADLIPLGPDPSGNPIYSLDMTLPKGDRGAQGLEPILQGGTTTTLNPGEQATSNLVPNGTDPATGKPIYKLDLGLPKGDQGSMATGDAKDLTVTFTEATTRTPLNSGEKMDVLFGKIKKWFSDLKTLAFTGKWGDVLEKPTTLEGYGVKFETAHIASQISLGKMLYTDPTFTSGMNGIIGYGDVSKVTITRVQGIDGNPNNSGYALRIRSVSLAAPAPGFGGFTFFTQSAANKVFITRFIAKIPVGYVIGFATNPTGNDTVHDWLTKWSGTGTWTEYIFRVTCGKDGTFSPTNFFYLSTIGGTVPTPESPLDWYLSSATVYDATDPEMTLDTRYATKTELTQVDQKIEDIQVGARNLILNSSRRIEGQSYQLHTYDLSRDLVAGQEYTLSLYGTLGSTKESWLISMGGGYTLIGYIPATTKRPYVLTFKAPNQIAGNGLWNQINIYQSPAENPAISILTGAKLEIGNKWTDYTEAPEDITSKITNIQVGGKNLFINPGFDNDYQGWRVNGEATIVLSWDNNRGKSLFITTTGGGQGVFQNPPRIVGNNYTTSVWMRTSGTTTSLKVIILSESTSAFKEFTLTPTWQLCTLTAPYSSTPGPICFYSRAAGNFVISNPKLERGDIYTDYQKEVSSYTTSSENLIQGTRYWVKDLSWTLASQVLPVEPQIQPSGTLDNYLRLNQESSNINIPGKYVLAGETITISIDVFLPVASQNAQYSLLLNQIFIGTARQVTSWVDTSPYTIPANSWTRLSWTYTASISGDYSLGLRCRDSNTFSQILFKRLKISRGATMDTGWSESPNEQQYLGGRNYIMNSTWNGGTSWWASHLPEGAGAITIDPNGINGNNAVTISRSEYTGTQRCGYQQNYSNALNQLKSLKKGVPYILSFKYKILTTLEKTSGYTEALLRVRNVVAGQPDSDVCRVTIPTETLPGDWVYATSSVYIPPVDQELVTLYILLAKNGSFSITEMMLEEATSPSGWQESDYWLLSRQNTAIKEAISNLQIGGTNYLRNSGEFREAGWNDGWRKNLNLAAWVVDPAHPYKGKGTLTVLATEGIIHPWLYLENGVEYTFSAMVKSDTTFAGTPSKPLSYQAGKGPTSQSKIQVTSYNQSVEANVWTKIYVTFKLTGDADMFRPIFYYDSTPGITYQIAYLKLEKGNKATDWCPSPEDGNQYNSWKGGFNGKKLYLDEDFSTSNNGIGTYGTITITRESDMSAPNTSKKVLKLSSTVQDPNGYYGGFTWSTPSSASKVYITRLIANIPRGYKLNFATNPIGESPSYSWMSSNVSSGYGWKEYIFSVQAGITGTFSTTNFFYISHSTSQGVVPSEAGPFIWYLASATVYDATAKSDADRISELITSEVASNIDYENINI